MALGSGEWWGVYRGTQCGCDQIMWVQESRSPWLWIIPWCFLKVGWILIHEILMYLSGPTWLYFEMLTFSPLVFLRPLGRRWHQVPSLLLQKIKGLRCCQGNIEKLEVFIKRKPNTIRYRTLHFLLHFPRTKPLATRHGPFISALTLSSFCSFQPSPTQPWPTSWIHPFWVWLFDSLVHPTPSSGACLDSKCCWSLEFGDYFLFLTWFLLMLHPVLLSTIPSTFDSAVIIPRDGVEHFMGKSYMQSSQPEVMTESQAVSTQCIYSFKKCLWSTCHIPGTV